MLLSPESAWVMGQTWSTQHQGAEMASGTQHIQHGRRGESTLAGEEQVLCILWLPVSWLLERKCHPSLLVLSVYFKEKRNRTKTTFGFGGREGFTILEEKQLN